ncbi:MAG: M66 family metalloprotease, partial [Myxococcaceae bacterium]
MTGAIARSAVAVLVLGSWMGCEGRAVSSPGGNPPGALEPIEIAENLPPTIAGFSGSPTAKPVPLQATFTWSVSDPEGDPLTCAIDFEGDGVEDEIIPDCSSSISAETVYLTPGNWTPRLTVRDASGESVTQSSELVTLPEPTVDVSIARVEWGQSVIDSRLRLVAGKPALLRVHVVSNEANTTGVVVRVAGVLNGVELGELEFEGPSALPTAVNDGQLEQSFRVLVPEAWIAPGLEVRVQVDPDGALFETDESNNGETIKPAIGAGTVLHLTAVPVVHRGTTATVPSTHTNALRRIWPLKTIESRTRAPYTFSGTLTGSSGSAWSGLLQELASVRASDGSRRYFYGFVKVAYGPGIAGIGYVGQPVATGRDDSLPTLVHELGHNFGRDHAPCGTDGDRDYPYPNGRLGSWGYDLQTQKLISPSTSYDLMSYCNPSWVSDYNYGEVQRFLEARPPVSLVAQGEMPLLLVSGRIAADGT